MSLAERVLKDSAILDTVLMGGGYTPNQSVAPNLNHFTILFGQAQGNLQLNRDVVLNIFSYLEVKDLKAVARVSRHWKAVSQDSDLWMQIVKREHPVMYVQLLTSMESTQGMDWMLTARLARNLESTQNAVARVGVEQQEIAQRINIQVEITGLCERLTYLGVVIIPFYCKVGQVSFRALKFCASVFI